MNLSAIIQARMGSTRFPGKVLADLCGVPMLEFQVSQIRKSKYISDIVVATSTNGLDDQIENLCESLNVVCFRGDEKDVLGRVVGAMALADSFNIVELYGDSPFYFDEILEILLPFYSMDDDLRVVTNTRKTTFSPGLELSIYSAHTLGKLNELIEESDPLREHVGYNFSRFADVFSIVNIEATGTRFYAPEFHLEVDEPIDLDFIRSIVERLSGKKINYNNISDLLISGELDILNASVSRRWREKRDD